MSRIQGKNTKPEKMVRQYLRQQGFGYRKHVSGLPGSPDIVLTKYNSVIFVNGCFWHGHAGCKYFVIPKTRTDWWLSKINRTKERDAGNHAQLKKEGWRVFILWECEIEHSLEQTMNELLIKIKEP